jgi:hypothetical protein
VTAGTTDCRKAAVLLERLDSASAPKRGPLQRIKVQFSCCEFGRLEPTGTQRPAFMEHSLAVSTEPRWSETQRTATLAAIDIMKTFFKADRVAAGAKINEHLKQIGSDGVISACNAFCGMLVKHVAELTGEDPMVVIYKAEETTRNVKSDQED